MSPVHMNVSPECVTCIHEERVHGEGVCDQVSPVHIKSGHMVKACVIRMYHMYT